MIEKEFIMGDYHSHSSFEQLEKRIKELEFAVNGGRKPFTAKSICKKIKKNKTHMFIENLNRIIDAVEKRGGSYSASSHLSIYNFAEDSYELRPNGDYPDTNGPEVIKELEKLGFKVEVGMVEVEVSGPKEYETKAIKIFGLTLGKYRTDNSVRKKTKHRIEQTTVSACCKTK
jgi:hypothetical protein